MTAGTEVVRNASRVARGLVSVQSRLTQVLDAQSSTGKALIEWYGKYNIALKDQDGQLRSTYDILSDVAKIWNTLSTNEKDYYLLTQAGANQTQNLAAIMNNFKTAIDATNTALDSAGSATEENAKYMESLEAKTQQLKATFQDLSANVIDNQLIKSILNLSNKGLEVLNTDVGRMVVQFTLLTSTMTGLAGVSKYMAGPILSGIIGAFNGATSAAIKSATGVGKLGLILGNFAPYAAIISAVAVALYKLYRVWQENNPSVEEATKRIGENTESLKHNKERLEEISKIPWPERTSEILNEKEALEKENSELEIQIKKLKELRQATMKEEQFKVFGPGNYTVTGATEVEAWKEFSKITGFTREELEQMGYVVDNINDQLISTAKDYISILDEQNKLTDEQQADFEEFSNNLNERVKILQDMRDQGEQLTSQEEELLGVWNQLNQVADESAKINAIINSGLASNEEEVRALIKKYPELANGIDNCTYATIELIAKQRIFNSEGLDISQKLAALQTLAAQAGITGAMLASIGNEKDMTTIIGDLINEGYSLEDAQRKYFEYSIARIGNIKPPKPSIDNVPVGGGGGGGKTSKPKPTDKALESFQFHYKNLQHMREMDEIDEERYYGDLRWLIDEYTRDATAHMEEYGLSVEKINQNMYQYEEEIYKARQELLKKSLEKQKEAYEAAFNYMAGRIQEEIDQLQSQRDDVEKYWDDKIEAIQKANEELNEQIKLEELEANLAKARYQKLLVFKDGKYQYISDIDEVSEAQTELDKYHREELLRQQVENLEELKKQALDSIDAQIESLEKYKKEWENATNDYKNNQDKLLAEQVLGIKLEGDNWKTRLDNLSNYVQQYNNILGNLKSLEDGAGKKGIGSAGGLTDIGGGLRLDAASGKFYDATTGALIEGVSIKHLTPEQLAAKKAAEEKFEKEHAGVGKTFLDDKGYATSDEGEKIKYTDKPYGGGNAQWSSKAPSMEKRPDLAGQTIHVGNDTITYNEHGGVAKITHSSNAKGTLNAPGGISLVGEKGPELRVLNGGDGIIPADVTKNLWQWGAISPSNLISSLSSIKEQGSSVFSVVIQNLSLPEVKNGSDFVNYLKNNLYSRAVQVSSK